MASRTVLQPTAKRPHKRSSKNLILRPAFQWKYTLMIVVGVFLVSALMGLELFGVLFQQARARVVAMGPTHPGEIRAALVFSTLGFAAVPALAFGVWSIFFTHRMCGPLLVMEGCLAELTEGRFPKRRRLRKKDEFKDFYVVFWRAINAIKARKRSDLKRYTEIMNLAKAAEQGDDDARGHALAQICEISETLCEEAQTALATKSQADDATAAATMTEQVESDLPMAGLSN